MRVDWYAEIKQKMKNIVDRLANFFTVGKSEQCKKTKLLQYFKTSKMVKFLNKYCVVRGCSLFPGCSDPK